MGSGISAVFSGTVVLLPTEEDCISCAVGAELVVIVSFRQARIRSWMLVKLLSSGVLAPPARMGLRSTCTVQVAMAASSSSAWHLYRASENRPLT